MESKSKKEQNHVISLTYRILKENDTDELIYKTERDHTDLENKHIVTKGERGEGINWEFGINIYPLLGIKQRNNKDL